MNMGYIDTFRGNGTAMTKGSGLGSTKSKLE